MMEPSKDPFVAPANPTIMVSEHSTTGPLETISQMRPAETTAEEDCGWGSETTPAADHQVPEHVTYGQNPQGQQRSDYKRLGILLRRCGIEHSDCTEGNDKLFWPTPLLERILTRERIVEELDAPTQTGAPFHFNLASSAIAKQILDGRIKIFAVLLLLDQVQCIERALAEGLMDSHLPFEPHGDYRQLYRASGSQTQLVQCFSGLDWKPAERDHFSIYQQMVDPRILEMDGDGRPKHEEFHPKAVLPFMQEVRQGMRKKKRDYGAFGVVSVVKIHPECHRFHDLLKSVSTIHLLNTRNADVDSQIKTHNGFAQKLLLKDDLEEFQREADVLKVFNGFTHPHIVTLLMTWKWNSSYYLLFPLAKCDLDKYWETAPYPTVDMESVRWTSSQLVGISSAVASIHDPSSNGSNGDIGTTRATLQVPDDNRYGRHGDLKPDNILLYESPDYAKGILVIADFGLSKLNSILSRSVQSNSRVPATPRYKPPECDIAGAKIKRSYDIWTFGCLALEWVCWLFGGQSARESFLLSLLQPYPSGSSKDMFFDMERRQNEEYNVVIKSEVKEVLELSHVRSRHWTGLMLTQKIAELHKSPKCTQYFHDLLDVIEEKTIIVRAENRIDAKALLGRLTTMDGVQNIDYYATPCPRPHVGRPQESLHVVFRRTTA
jgi:serine/threonine protein kinase